VDEAQLTAFLEAAFAFACERRVNEFIDTNQILTTVDAVTAPERVARILTRFVGPARNRLIGRARASALALGVWLPEPARQAIAAALGQPAPIPRAVIDEVVASERVRDSVRAMLQEALSSVISKGFAAAPGGTGKGLRGMIGFGARAAGAASRGILGGLGDEIQRQLEDRVRDFVDGGVGLVQKRLAEKLASEETAVNLGKRRRRAFLDLLARTEKQAGETMERVPYPFIDGLTPVVIQHNLQRAEVREALRAEVDAALTELGTQTVGELLDELGLRATVMDVLQTRGLALATAFLASPHYAKWSQR
jgi:hypothetical protein